MVYKLLGVFSSSFESSHFDFNDLITSEVISAWQAIMDSLLQDTLVNLAATGLIWWALRGLLEFMECILDGISFEEDNNCDEEGVPYLEEMLDEEYEEGGFGDDVDQVEEEVESEYEESDLDVEENEENGLKEGRENIRGGSDGNNFLSEECLDCGSKFHFSCAVSLPVAVVSPLATGVDVGNVLAGALREAAPEFRVSAQETEQIMKGLHSVECQTFLKEERERGVEEHEWRGCKLYLKHDLVDKYFRFVRTRVSLPRGA